MDQPAVLPTSIHVVLWGGTCISFLAWLAVGWRLWQRRPLIEFQRRRQVPWGGLDLICVAVFFVFASLLMAFVLNLFLGSDAGKPLDGADAEVSHAIVQLIRGGNIWAMIIGLTAAVLVAPVVEEFLFRVLLQGWLESVDRRLGLTLREFRGIVPWGVCPIILSSLIFAMVHIRFEKKPFSPEYLFYMLAGNSLVGLATVIFSVLLIRLKNGATAADFGFVTKEVPHDVGLGLATAAAVILPVYMVHGALQKVMPSWIAADPLPIFFLSLALGALYCRTHRVVASIVLHMTFNAFGLAMLLLHLMG